MKAEDFDNMFESGGGRGRIWKGIVSDFEFKRRRSTCPGVADVEKKRCVAKEDRHAEACTKYRRARKGCM